MDLQAALAVARLCKQPPGKAKANEYLKLCRERMRMAGEQVNIPLLSSAYFVESQTGYSQIQSQFVIDVARATSTIEK